MTVKGQGGMSGILPPGYEALEPFAARWAIAGENERALLRGSSTPEERQAFYDAVRDRVMPALDELDRKPLAELTDQEQRLLRMLLSFAHVALAIEVQGADEAKHAELRAHMPITPTSTDRRVWG
jgi:hypothetical protein